jgi:hypothetical protein
VTRGLTSWSSLSNSTTSHVRLTGPALDTAGDLLRVRWVAGRGPRRAGQSIGSGTNSIPHNERPEPPPGSHTPLCVAPSPTPAAYQCNSGVLTTCDLPVTVCVRRVLCLVSLTSADLRSLWGSRTWPPRVKAVFMPLVRTR